MNFPNAVEHLAKTVPYGEDIANHPNLFGHCTTMILLAVPISAGLTFAIGRAIPYVNGDPNWFAFIWFVTMIGCLLAALRLLSNISRVARTLPFYHYRGRRRYRNEMGIRGRVL